MPRPRVADLRRRDVRPLRLVVDLSLVLLLRRRGRRGREKGEAPVPLVAGRTRGQPVTMVRNNPPHVVLRPELAELLVRGPQQWVELQRGSEVLDGLLRPSRQPADPAEEVEPRCAIRHPVLVLPAVIAHPSPARQFALGLRQLPELHAALRQEVPALLPLPAAEGLLRPHGLSLPVIRHGQDVRVLLLGVLGKETLRQKNSVSDQVEPQGPPHLFAQHLLVDDRKDGHHGDPRLGALASLDLPLPLSRPPAPAPPPSRLSRPNAAANSSALASSF